MLDAMRWGVGDKRQCGLTSLHSSVVSGLCGGDAMPPVVSSSTYWIPPSAREACPPPDKLPDQTRNYVDPWDLENYAYLRRHARIDHTNPLPNRRRSVAFDEAVHYASYSDDAYGPLSLDEGYLHDVVYEEPTAHYHCPYHRSPNYYREYQEIDNLDCQGLHYDDDIYDGLMQILSKKRKPSSSKHFRLSTLGHLRIDYSSNWSKLDRFIGHR